MLWCMILGFTLQDYSQIMIQNIGICPRDTVKAMIYLFMTAIFLFLYFLSSGIAFVSIYKYPESNLCIFYGYIYRPLDWLGEKSMMFQKIYTGYHHWCYRKWLKLS